MRIWLLIYVHLHIPLPSKYPTPLERRHRFESFKDSLNEVDVLNAAVKARNGTEVYGITKFIDFLPWELRSGAVKRSHDLEFIDYPSGEARSGSSVKYGIIIFYDLLTGKNTAGNYAFVGTNRELLGLLKYLTSVTVQPFTYETD